VRKYEEYMGVIADAFEAQMAVCVFRNENDGLDHSALLSQEDQLFVRLPDLLLSDRNSSLQVGDLCAVIGHCNYYLFAHNKYLKEKGCLFGDAILGMPLL
jgi:hypothetical protein